MEQSLHRYKASLFKSLAHPLRLAILDALRDGEKTVTQLQELTGGEQATISQHLTILRTHHFITFRKEGTLAYYRNEDPEVYVFLDLGRQLYERQLNRYRREIDAQVIRR
ncbi:winged helix-turn-helix transcriptional regulator [Deinococcus sp. KSM4-11]|uniref:ArsR/SmtB family transcription factor n=1 Tax=Deinococcus sp. KSM4-11 TaxID=2568654 RepID=UPI0010A54C10|nr:metalloregulator ArsR/SmtB family transcription factor [Deinococcus sp. KSM4-11]THF84348.1 winged helix-turn-helix transcriptional regulator [Deinococcus sp. KSM4-11]